MNLKAYDLKIDFVKNQRLFSVIENGFAHGAQIRRREFIQQKFNLMCKTTIIMID